MIQVKRTAKPQVLQRYSHSWLADLQVAVSYSNRLALDPNTTQQAKKRAKDRVDEIQKKYNHSKVKQALVEMFHGKCAYCESPITGVTYGNIEHFYPKAQYIDKTFEWENLLLACDICNNAQHKGTKFPLDSKGVPLLIDPTDGFTDPANHLRFSWDQQAGLASIYGRNR